MAPRFSETSQHHQHPPTFNQNPNNFTNFSRQQGPRRMHNNQNIRGQANQYNYNNNNNINHNNSTNNYNNTNTNNNSNDNHRAQKQQVAGGLIEQEMDYHRRNVVGGGGSGRDDRPLGKYFDQDGPPAGGFHLHNHQDNRGASYHRPATGRNQSFEGAPDNNRGPNWRKNSAANNANNGPITPPLLPTSSTSANPVKDPIAIGGGLSGVHNPIVPKPPTKINATNFSLRPSHNLVGRTLSGPNAQVQQKQSPSGANNPVVSDHTDMMMTPKQKDVSQDVRNDFKQADKLNGDHQKQLEQQQAVGGSKRNENEEGESGANGINSAATNAAKDFHVNKFTSILSEYSNNEKLSTQSTLSKATSRIKELKIPKSYQADCLVSVMKQSIVKSELDRENTSRLVAQLVPSVFEVSSLVGAFKTIFEQLHGLEVETPRVKSMVAGFLSKSVHQGPLALEEVANILVGGKHHPLFLLVLQQLEKSAGQVWLSEKFLASKINLMDMLPEADRTKERLASSLKDRCLGFLDPMLTIEPDLWAQMSERDASPAAVYRWIKDNVELTIQTSPTFAHVLMGCLLRYINNTIQERLKSMEQQQQQQQKDSTDDTDGSNKSSPTNSSSQSGIDLEKELLTKYQQVLQALLSGKQMQLATLYSLQSYYYGLDFPKGALLRWFHMLYDLEIVDDDVFFTWKEEINDEIPGKGQALFQVNTWLNWLAEAEYEEEDEA